MAGLSRGVAATVLTGVALLASSCGGDKLAGPAASAASAARLVAPGMAGTHGNVVFASAATGWVVAPHPARHETDVYRTTDGGVSWTLWSSLPEEAGSPTAVGESAVLLMPRGNDRSSDHLMFRADGGRWERRDLPIMVPNGNVTIQVLSDMRHGWLVPWQDRDLFRTVDGGRTWQMVSSLHEFENAGSSDPFFWNATDGMMFYQLQDRFVYRQTRDSGASWQAVDVPAINAKADLGTTDNVIVSGGLPTMFDSANGVLQFSVFRPPSGSSDSPLTRYVYLAQTTDGGRHWSAAKLFQLPAAGQLELLDSRRWLLAGDQYAYYTIDAGQHWRESEGLGAGLWRGSGGFFAVPSSDGSVFMIFRQSDIEWLAVSTDAGAHWRPVPLPDIREATWLGSF
ncbi:MAG TPA: sialidase family protein [Candidatus Limnocylindrales bacterium]|nr:sialidase family protein [Candidatus Limnocylindrales bacterium]